MQATATPPSSTVLALRVVPAVRLELERIAYERDLTLSQATRELLSMALEQVQASR